MNFEDILVKTHDRVGWLTINRPEKQNALRQQTFAEIDAALAGLDRDSDVRVVVLTGAGDRAFSAGIDLEADGLPDDSEGWDDHTKGNARVVSRLWYLDKPVITAVNGYALAAGCNLAVVGDLTIASSTAFLAEPEIRHGALSPLLMLPWLTTFKAFNEIYLTGDRVSAHRAQELGLVNKVVEPDELEAQTQAYARRVANAPTYALTLAKRAVRLSMDIQGFKAAQDAHRYVDTYLLASNGLTEKEKLMSTLANEGMRAFLEARDRPYGER
jgi:enoyl-CoA hydratase/carnithine racemase